MLGTYPRAHTGIIFTILPSLLTTLGTATKDYDASSSSRKEAFKQLPDNTNGLLQTMVSLPPTQPNIKKAKALSPTDLTQKWVCRAGIDGKVKYLV